MRDYPLIPLNDLCTTINSGGTPSRREPDFWVGGTIPWIKTGELNDWKVQSIGERITEAGLNGSSAKLYPAGTVLIAMYGDGRTITTMGIVDVPAATNQACCALIADPAVCDPIYLFFALKERRHELLNLVVAGAQRNLSVGTIRNFPVRVPPLPMQRRIASILGAYNDLIEVNERRIAVLEEMNRGLFEEWFVRFRFPGHEEVPILDTPDGLLPQEWTWASLESFVVLQRGFDLPKGRRVDGDIPVFSASGLHGGHNEHKVNGPGIVTGRSGTIGQVHLIMENFWPLNTTLYVREFKRAGPAYAMLLLQQMDLSKYSGGAAVPTLNRNHIHDIKLPAAPQALIDKFESFAFANLQCIRIMERQNAKLSASRDLLLPRLISGQLSLAGAERGMEEAA